MNYYMICHLFFLLAETSSSYSRSPPAAQASPFCFIILTGAGERREGRGHFLFIRVDVKRENGQFKVELLVSWKLFTLQLHLLNTGGRGGSFSLQTAKRSECCHGGRSQGIVFPRVFFNESWRIFIGFCWDFHFLWPAGIKAARSFWV